MKALDYIIIFCVSLAVLLGSAFIFMGTAEDIADLRENLFNSVFIRTLSFGLPAGLILFGIRYMMFQLLLVKEDQPGRKTLLYGSLIIGVIAALAGTLIFFYGGSEIALRGR